MSVNHVQQRRCVCSACVQLLCAAREGIWLESVAGQVELGLLPLMAHVAMVGVRVENVYRT